MIDHSKAKKFVDRNMPRLLREYGIPHWKIDVEFFQDSEGRQLGTSCADPEYEQATIRLNTAHDDLEDFEDTLRHELCHILHSPFETYRKMVSHLVSEQEFKALDVAWSVAAEQTVKNLERMHVGHR